MKGEGKRIERESELICNLAAYQAWRTAVFMRVEKLPKKPDDLGEKKKVKSVGSDWQAQKAMIMALNAGLGGNVVGKQEKAKA